MIHIGEAASLIISENPFSTCLVFGAIPFYVLHDLGPDYRARARSFLPSLLLFLLFYLFGFYNTCDRIEGRQIKYKA